MASAPNHVMCAISARTQRASFRHNTRHNVRGGFAVVVLPPQRPRRFATRLFSTPYAMFKIRRLPTLLQREEKACARVRLRNGGRRDDEISARRVEHGGAAATGAGCRVADTGSEVDGDRRHEKVVERQARRATRHRRMPRSPLNACRRFHVRAGKPRTNHSIATVD